MKLAELKGWELRELIKKGETGCKEAVASFLDEIKKKNKSLNSFLTLTEESALKSAEIVDKKVSQKQKLGALAGIPIAVKDNICLRGVKTTCGSHILDNFVPPYNATVVEKLKKEDAIIIGKTNLDEFAMGSSTENSYFGPSKNPHDLKKVPGGSSGGSAVAVASGLATMALGSDTGGSIRQPAALCGVVGLKPTYGTVSRYGLVAFASSLDQIGPLTKDVKDSALLFGVISGHDPNDSTSLKISSKDYLKTLDSYKTKFKVAVPKEAFGAGNEKDVEEAVKKAIKLMEKLNWSVSEVSLPYMEYAIATYYIIATAEASSNLARYDGVKYGYRSKDSSQLLELYQNTRGEGFGNEVKRRIMLGTYVLSAGYYEAYYGKGQKVRTFIKQDFDNVFKDFDIVIMPTSPTVAFGLGEKIEDPLTMYLSDIFTVSANLAGIPAISIPCGKSKAGLPIGLQILAKPLAEETIFKAAYMLEQNLKT
ncbi:MAG: hypothetical protein RBG1_1C00001G0966 [candidate division Zixibacteria bacterium RBG-1]|nr:MAG: hypothetical protein RBG1_1C00001G0966 [candidate division Zixibacteria bacterium RBG-1]OGC83756.1 MAG: aspartyl/glutamyl-tRNA amidotransferase subunit A [candidate division Zixibacteria bacterium RBG_19FT_COMBO_42_43]